jgi:phosphate-selective porin OprO/OprP
MIISHFAARRRAKPGGVRLLLARLLALLLSGAGFSVTAEAQDFPSAHTAAHRRSAIARLPETSDTWEAAPVGSPAALTTAFAAQDVSSMDIRAEVERYLAEKQEQEEAQKREADEAGYEVGSDLAMTAKWNHGLELSTKNHDFRVHVGGRTQFDTSWFSVDDDVQNNINIPYQDGVDFRRARLRVDGTLYEVLEWVAEYDFVNAARIRNAAGTGTFESTVTAFTDLWVQAKELPRLGNVRIGNQKEPIGFEHLVSSRFQPFIERSFNQDAFYGGLFNGFTPGIQAFDTYDQQWGTWAVGLFKPTDNVFAFNATDGDYAVTGRVTRLLWYVDDGSGLLHVGLSGRQFTTVNDRIRYRTRDAVRAGIASVWPVPADTGTIAGDTGQFINGELVAVHGPWTLQSEWLVSFLDDAQIVVPAAGPQESIMYHGGYIQLLYFLTGEHDQYNRRTGFFDRVIPRENFFRVCTPDGPQMGRGAWQIGARYNYLDLNDKEINGGILHNATVGLNWFLNPNMKLQFDYIATHRDAPLAGDAGDGWIHGWGFRLANDF